jgi:outer membrane protein
MTLSNSVRAAAVALLLIPATVWEARAQSSEPGQPGPTLSLEEARDLARRRSPSLQQVINDRRPADAALRAAYGGFLPTVDASLSGQYQQGGEQIFSGASLGAGSDVLQSSYRIGLTQRINSATFIAPRLQRAQRDAVDADIEGAEALLRSSVTDRYLAVLEAEANSELQDSLVVSAETQLVLSRAREIVGAGTALDIRRSEIALGQAEVARIQARNAADVAKLRLFQEIGVEPRVDVELTSEFEVTPLALTLNDLLATAQRENPALEATRQRARVADLALASRRGEYTPTLTLSTGWGGYTYEFRDSNFLVNQTRAQLSNQQASCIFFEQRFAAAGLPSSIGQCQNGFSLTDEQALALRRQNDQFPFNFTRNPRSLIATVSLPLFDGFSREARVQEAAAQRADARHAERARELALTADVTAAYLTVESAQRSASLQEQNAAKARDELRLSQDRYRLGAATFLDLMDSQNAFARAESDRIRAVYEYHRAFAALESAVGRSLR